MQVGLQPAMFIIGLSYIRMGTHIVRPCLFQQNNFRLEDKR